MTLHGAVTPPAPHRPQDPRSRRGTQGRTQLPEQRCGRLAGGSGPGGVSSYVQVKGLVEERVQLVPLALGAPGRHLGEVVPRLQGELDEGVAGAWRGADVSPCPQHGWGGAGTSPAPPARRPPGVAARVTPSRTAPPTTAQPSPDRRLSPWSTFCRPRHGLRSGQAPPAPAAAGAAKGRQRVRAASRPAPPAASRGAAQTPFFPNPPPGTRKRVPTESC